jgi:hypothetical protein
MLKVLVNQNLGPDQYYHKNSLYRLYIELLRLLRILKLFNIHVASTQSWMTIYFWQISWIFYFFCSEFTSDYLRCDCHLQWIVKWSREKNVKIQSSTTCAVPSELKSRPLRKLKKEDLHCGMISYMETNHCLLPISLHNLFIADHFS